MSLRDSLSDFLPTRGAYVRLMKLADRANLPKEIRLEAAFLLIEKALKENNLEEGAYLICLEWTIKPKD